MFVQVRILDFAFFDFLDLDKFFIILLLSLPPITSSSLALNTLKVKSNNLIVFKIEISDAAILLKSQIKR